MPPSTDLDRLVARAQRGDAAALEAVCARARPLLVRHARRLVGSPGDAEDAAQEVLMLVARKIGEYRWEGSFAGWLYVVSTRYLLRAEARSAGRATVALELVDRALVSDHEAMTEAEWRLVEQELHLSCALGVLVGVSSDTRLVYLLGELLGVPDTVGAEVFQSAPAAYRKRLQRARQQVASVVRDGVDATSPLPSDPVLQRAAREVDALARLGELHRAHARAASSEGALRAVRLVAPTLAA